MTRDQIEHLMDLARKAFALEKEERDLENWASITLNRVAPGPFPYEPKQITANITMNPKTTLELCQDWLDMEERVRELEADLKEIGRICSQPRYQQYNQPYKGELGKLLDTIKNIALAATQADRQSGATAEHEGREPQA
jgi:hypothetical protein